MILAELVNNNDFDINCDLMIYQGCWNDAGKLVWDTRNNSSLQLPNEFANKQIKYITLDIERKVIVIEI